MAPWVIKVFINVLPRILCIERPKKDSPACEDDTGPPEVLTDGFHCEQDVDKFAHDYNTTEYGMPGKFFACVLSPLLSLSFCRCLESHRH